MKTVPSKYSSTRSNQPWFNTATKRVLRRKSRAFKKARRTNKERDWRRFQRLQKEGQLTCRRAYYKFTYDVIHSDPASRRNKKLGALIKSKRLDNLGVAPLKDRGFIHCDPRTKANILNRQFTSVFSTDDGSRLPDLPDVHHPVMEDITVCQNGVIKLLRNLKAFTASGADDIPTKLLKETAVERLQQLPYCSRHRFSRVEYHHNGRRQILFPYSRKEAALLQLTTGQYR